MPSQTVFSKTEQLYQYIENGIRSGRLQPGNRLPSMREQAKLLGVSTTVVNQAYAMLEERKMIVRRERQAVYVNTVEAQKRFLVVTYHGGFESPIHYIYPEFELVCRNAGVVIDQVEAEFLRAGQLAELLPHLRKKGYSAALLLNSRYTGEELEYRLLKALNIPVMIPRSNYPEPENSNFYQLLSDCGDGWRAAVAMLQERGYRRIAALHLKDDEQEQRRGEVAGFVLERSVSWYDGVKFNAELTELFSHQLDAVLCYSDFVALRVYDYCRGHGIRIPEDLAVMGFCGYPGGAFLKPALSTVDLQYAELGRYSAAFLLRVIDGWKPDTHCIPVPCKLEIRESTPDKGRQK